MSGFIRIARGQPIDTYERARSLLAHLNAEIKDHTFDPSKYLKTELSQFYFSTVSRIWLDEKLREVKQGFKAYSYVRKLEAYCEKYFDPFFKNKDIRDVRRVHLDEFKASLPDTLSPKTIKNVMTALKNLFAMAERKEIIGRIPSFPGIHVPEYTGWKWVDADTQGRIIEAVPERDRGIFVFLFLHGCRPGEARALKAKDIDFGAGLIRIRRTFSEDTLRETTKQKRQNIVPLHSEFAPYLRELLKSSLPEAFVLAANSIGWALFEAKDQKPVRLIDCGARVFEEGLADIETDGKGKSRNIGRREARLRRRQCDRRSRRLAHLARFLQRSGLLPTGKLDSPEERHEFFTKLDKSLLPPLQLRADALNRKLELTSLAVSFIIWAKEEAFSATTRTEG